jgi:hypothetical protein
MSNPKQTQAQKDFNFRQSIRYHDNRRFMDKWKKDRGCEAVDLEGNVCGYNVHPSALQFDHIDPLTKYRTKSGRIIHPSHMVRFKREVIIAELNKCRVLCANCHMIYTHTIQREISKIKKDANKFLDLRRVEVDNVSGCV